jgi:hypothetical protein
VNKAPFVRPLLRRAGVFGSASVARSSTRPWVIASLFPFALSLSSSIWAFNTSMHRFTSIANKTLSFCWNLEVEVFSGGLKGAGRFPAALSSRPPRTRHSPCGDDARAGTLSVALRRFFLRPHHLITILAFVRRSIETVFPLLCNGARLLVTI